jgi:hypothetical protein
MAWSDRKAWWMDLLKSAVSYILGAVITIGIFIYWLDREKHMWEANYELKLETFKEYEKASSQYHLTAYDALRDVYGQGENRDIQTDIKKWEDEAFDNLYIAQHSLKQWFGINGRKNRPINCLLKRIDSIRSEMKNDYRAAEKLTLNDSLKRQLWLEYSKGRWLTLKLAHIRLDSQILERCRRLME